MKYVFFVALFFVSFCFAIGTTEAEQINLDSDVLSKLPWEYHVESGIWLKFSTEGERETIIIIEKVTLSDTTRDTESVSLQFTLSTTCPGKDINQLVSWKSKSTLAEVLLCDGREGKMQIQPFVEQSLYPLPQEALEYLASKSEN